MEEKKKLSKYIGGSNAGLVIGCVCLVLCMILVIVGLFVSLHVKMNTVAEEFFPLDSELHSTCYIKAIAVSDWIYQYDKDIYYNVMDEEGYLFVVKLNSATLKKLDAQRDYWDDESLPIPIPYRLTGVVRSIPSRVKDGFCKAWEISGEEFDWYFGDRLLDTTTTQSADAAGSYYVLAFLLGLIAIPCLVLNLPRKTATGRTLQQLENSGLLPYAAWQMDSPGNLVIGKNRGLVTQDFLIGRNTGYAIPIRDILWIYQRNHRRNFVPVNAYLVVSTAQQKEISVISLGRPDNGELSQAVMQIAARNPNIIYGYSAEARIAYEQRTGKQ